MQASADRWEVSNGQVPAYHSPLHILSYRNYHFFYYYQESFLPVYPNLCLSISVCSPHTNTCKIEGGKNW